MHGHPPHQWLHWWRIQWHLKECQDLDTTSVPEDNKDKKDNEEKSETCQSLPMVDTGLPVWSNVL